ncbi:MAG: hypothetical protein R3F07_06890 [Opitutaceae bacterium]
MGFPFNDRRAFLPEHEELLIRTLMARLAAFPSLYIVDPANEYNLYLADRNSLLNDAFAIRFARLIRAHDPYLHPMGIHVTAAERMDPPFQDRFRHNPEIDILLMRTWGALGNQEGTVSGKRIRLKDPHLVTSKQLHQNRILILRESGG